MITVSSAVMWYHAVAFATCGTLLVYCVWTIRRLRSALTDAYVENWVDKRAQYAVVFRVLGKLVNSRTTRERTALADKIRRYLDTFKVEIEKAKERVPSTHYESGGKAE